MIAPSQLPYLIHRIGTPESRIPIARPSRRLGARVPDAGAEVAIRVADVRDSSTLRDLEELDGHALPDGRHLLAELGGVPVAAIAVADDTVVADPFARTSAVVDLLRVRARQLRVAA